MFTGIIEETGRVEAIAIGAKAIQLSVRVELAARSLKIGDSLAVNGCCLTTVAISRKKGARAGAVIRFDLLRETWQRTNFQFLKPQSLVNLERPLAADGRMDGHFVTGHIDGTGKITRWERSGRDHVLDIEPSREVTRYIITKGSIAVDGISLTVAEARKKDFRVWIIPHTYRATNLQNRRVGDAVNLEADLLGKYVERFVENRMNKG